MTDINEELLYALAQIAITLTGLSGIVIALATPESRKWGTFERANMWYILGHGTAAFTAAMTPALLHIMGLSTDQLWQISFWVFACISLALTLPALALVARALRDKELFKQVTSTFIGSFIFYEATGFAIMINTPLVLASFNWLIPPIQFVYVLLVVLIILLTLLHFAYFLAINSRSEAES